MDIQVSLVQAAGHGDLNTVRQLLADGADPKAAFVRVEAQYRSVLTPLNAAVRGGELSVVRLLLDHGADPNAESREYIGYDYTHSEKASLPLGSALHRAPHDLALVRMLLEYGADPNRPLTEDYSGTKGVWDIATEPDDMAAVLLSFGAAPKDALTSAARRGAPLTAWLNLVHPLWPYAPTLDWPTLLAPETPAETLRVLRARGLLHPDAEETADLLLRAIETDAVDSALSLIAQGAPIEALAPDKTSPLVAAAGRRECRPVVEALLREGANPNATVDRPDGKRDTPLSQAAQARESAVAILLLLLDAGATVDGRCGAGAALTPLLLADAKGATLLLEHGANIHTRDSHGRTALQRTSDVAMIAVLLRYGARHDVIDEKGETPLLALTQESPYQITEAALVLIQAGADVNRIARSDGRSALLRTAANFDDSDAAAGLFALLMAQGADVRVRDTAGDTALHLLFSTHSPRAADSAALRMRLGDLLLYWGADINARNTQGRTVLSRLVEESSLRETARIEVEDPSRPAPSRWAAALLTWLEEHGAIE